MQNQVELPAAVIFDMDGVLVDSNPYHLAKWVDFLNHHKIAYREEDLPELILGKRNDTAFRYFLGPNLTPEESKRMSEELEETFRRVFKPYAKPLPGLDRLIKECHAAGVPMAVASSAVRTNIEFVVDALGYRPYFSTMVSGDDVRHAKPDPEIYLKAAGQLGIDPTDAVGFEDSYVGIGAVKNAGMKCVAVASTFPFEKLVPLADLVIPTFEDINLEKLHTLFVAEGESSSVAR
ncbi:MAG: HAD family phosphatase [Acidobacteria bacterium]|nr:MAG: HAD family phosphatase [Acidobacteriota bacterium]